MSKVINGRTGLRPGQSGNPRGPTRHACTRYLTEMADAQCEREGKPWGEVFARRLFDLATTTPAEDDAWQTGLHIAAMRILADRMYPVQKEGDKTQIINLTLIEGTGAEQFVKDLTSGGNGRIVRHWMQEALRRALPPPDDNGRGNKTD